jgi:hypothetical protein
MTTLLGGREVPCWKAALPADDPELIVYGNAARVRGL